MSRVGHGLDLMLVGIITENEKLVLLILTYAIADLRTQRSEFSPGIQNIGASSYGFVDNVRHSQYCLPWILANFRNFEARLATASQTLSMAELTSVQMFIVQQHGTARLADTHSFAETLHH